MNIKIEKDVPIPQKNKSRYTEYPFAEMNVGDSFFVEIPVGKRSDVVRGQVYNKAIRYCRRNKNTWKFSTLIVGNGVRIWRIK